MKSANIKLGFIGFGEVASAFCTTFKEAGLQDIVVFHRRWRLSQEKARRIGVALLPSINDVVSEADIIISSVWPNTALEVAQEAAKSLSGEKLYVDSNTLSPPTVQQLEKLVTAKARFAYAAVMDAVSYMGSKVPMSCSGEGAEAFADFARNYGLNVTVVGKDPRQAAALKILRGLALKGFSMCLHEALLGAHRYKITEQLVASTAEWLNKAPFPEIVELFETSNFLHAQRRMGEMEEASVALQAVGIESIMSKGVKAAYEQLDLAISSLLRKDPAPRSYREVLERLLA